MLVLSRKQGEGLLIDGTTVVRILEVKGNRIRLGIEAPDDVNVVRLELCEFHMDAPVGKPAGAKQAAFAAKRDRARATATTDSD